VSLAIPERGLMRKDRLGGAVAELHYLCERPGKPRDTLVMNTRCFKAVQKFVWPVLYLDMY
jgi:hypothetical protein